MEHEPSITRGDPTEPHYPQTGTHTWGAFAGLAIELGGYGDLEVVDPYSGDRLWIPDAFEGDSDHEMANALRKLAGLVESGRFPGWTADPLPTRPGATGRQATIAASAELDLAWTRPGWRRPTSRR